MDRLTGTLQELGRISGTLSGVGSMSAGLSVPTGKAVAPYTGAYEYTPTSETQVIEIEGLRALSNIIIDPVPQNYGLISWDGSTLTVS